MTGRAGLQETHHIVLLGLGLVGGLREVGVRGRCRGDGSRGDGCRGDGSRSRSGLLLCCGGWSWGLGSRVVKRRRTLLAQDQLHQLLLLTAHLRGHLVQVEVVPQVLHLQLHQLRALEQGAVETLAGVAQPRSRFQLGRTPGAVGLLTVHTDVLSGSRTG